MIRREPDFENVLKLLRREATPRPVLFELAMNRTMYRLANGCEPGGEDSLSFARFTVDAFRNLGYDYATLYGSSFCFMDNARQKNSTVSLNDGAVILDEESFDAFEWPDPNSADYSTLEKIRPYLPDGMKLMIMGPGGVLENAIELVGYDNLCYMIYDEPELVQCVFDEVGSRLVDYYRNVVQYDSVGFVCSNDDWGFNTQTMLSHEHMRQYVIPWHKKIVETAHAAGRPIILHSCGNVKLMIDDIVGIGYDAKHSFEDNIFPIEDAYEAWHDRIALLGGIDMDFVIRSPEEQLRSRVAAMLERTRDRGGWAVGTGNSVPEYVPVSQYIAMIETALGYNPLNR